MVYLLVLVFLAGPLAEREFTYKEDGQNITEFSKLEDCVARAKEIGPKVRQEFTNSGQPELAQPFKMGCKPVEKV
jgi:hypothetical protein